MSFQDSTKPWFETGDYPTQEQFYQMFDWLRWKDEAIAIGDITNLTDILNQLSQPIETFITAGGDFNYTVAAGFLLEKIILIPFSDCKPYATIDKVGGGTETMIPQDDDTTMTALEGNVWVVNKLAIAARDITIFNLPTGSKVFIIRKKIL